MGVHRRRIAALVVLGVWAGGAGCTLFDPLSGLSGSGGEGGTGHDGPSADDAFDVTMGDDGPVVIDARSEDATSSGDVNGGDASTAGYERAVTVTAADAVSAGYVVGFSLDTASLVAAGKMRSDLNDLRVFDPTGMELDRVVDTGSPSFVWFALTRAIASNASDSYAVHYGNPGAGAPPADGGAVFTFYDDFPGTALSAQKWVPLGSPSVAGGAVTLHAFDADASPNPDSLRTDPQTDGIQGASWLEIVATVTNPDSGPGVDPSTGDTFWYWIGFQRQGDFVAAPPWILWISRQTTQVQCEISNGPDASASGGALGEDTMAHDYVIARAPSSTSFYRDGAQALSAPISNPMDMDMALMLRNWMVSSDVVVSLVRDRPLVDDEPTVTVGAERSLP